MCTATTVVSHIGQYLLLFWTFNIDPIDSFSLLILHELLTYSDMTWSKKFRNKKKTLVRDKTFCLNDVCLPDTMLPVYLPFSLVEMRQHSRTTQSFTIIYDTGGAVGFLAHCLSFLLFYLFIWNVNMSIFLRGPFFFRKRLHSIRQQSKESPLHTARDTPRWLQCCSILLSKFPPLSPRPPFCRFVFEVLYISPFLKSSLKNDISKPTLKKRPLWRKHFRRIHFNRQ
jgi:hypothetical protein